MFSIFKKKPKSKVDLSWLGTDLHSHLIPGIDDGAQDMADSVELINGLKSLGYSKLITTPHILWEMYPNTAEIIMKGAGEVESVIEKEGIGVQFKAAAEYFIDEHFQELLEKKIPLLPIHDNIVLVEFSMITAPMDLQEIFFEMQLQGYIPLVAHPERYAYLRMKKSFFDELKNSGCLFQLNLLSLTGHYGNSILDLGEYLIKKEYYDYAGTDLHHLRHLEQLQKLPASTCYWKLKDSEMLKNHLI